MTALNPRDRSANWTRLANAPEGEREHHVWLMIKARGVDWVCAHVDVERGLLEQWARDGLIPPAHGPAVHAALKSHLAIECRAGRGKIDVEEAARMRAEGWKQDAIAAHFGATQQCVGKALARRERRARKRDALTPQMRVEGVKTPAQEEESDAA